jgi:hypothetical protein
MVSDTLSCKNIAEKSIVCLSLSLSQFLSVLGTKKLLFKKKEKDQKDS